MSTVNRLKTGLAFFLARRAKRARYKNYHARDRRRFLRRAAITPLTNSQEKERLLAVYTVND